MAIGIGFANEYDEGTFEDFYREELEDSPIGIGGFVSDICYERAKKRYELNQQSKEREQGFI